jgi:uncharacterized repeat protein (TIGR02543 family)
MAGIQVSFDAQGGSEPVPAMIYVALGQAYGELPLSTREGYGFGGWWTEMGGLGSQVLADTLVATDTDHTLYAHWIANAHTVTFDAQGGSAPSPATLVVNYGQPYGTLATTEREGYGFGGWWTEAGGMGQEITAQSIVAVDADHTLYAHWIAGAYTVSFDAQGGSEPVPATIAVVFGEAYGVLAATSREGYTFAGWWTEAEGGEAISEASIVAVAGNHTLYAHWTANDYVVSFDAQGGSAPSPATLNVTFGQAYGTLPMTDRTGYTFAGWWTEMGGMGEQVSDTALVAIAADHTLYAHWSANQYTVSFDAQGGTDPVPPSKLVTFDAAYGELALSSRDGYSFAGWWTEMGGNGTQIFDTTLVELSTDHTLYAHWTANSYTVSFDAQGGVASLSDKVVTFDAAYGELPTATREGYSFAGWWTEMGGMGTEITDASIVAIPSDHTLYAYWMANSYTVSFDAQGGVATPTELVVSFDAAYGALASATRQGYTFEGWWTEAVGGTQVLDSSIVSVAADHTLYAHWTANSYAVSFDGNGGGTPDPSSITVTFDAPYGALATVSRTGYTFDGWWTTANGGTQVFDTTVVSTGSDHTLYAHWSANTYTVTFDGNGGGTPSPTTKVVTFGAPYGALAAVSRPGYALTGWWTAASGGTQVLDTTVVSTASNHTLYAHWNATGPCNGVIYNNYCYEALDGTLYTNTTVGCQTDYLPLPAGWSLVPYAADIELNVVRPYPWGTHVMVFSEGGSYGTSLYSPGFHYSPSLLVQGSTYKPVACSYRILIRKELTCGNGVVDPSEEYDPPPGPFSSVSVDSGTCTWDFASVPQLYCNGTCTWAGAQGCDQADADIFCKLKTGNPASTASSFTTGTALDQPGFSCPGQGTNLGPKPLRGVSVNVWYQDSSILANHGGGQVINGATCTNP